MNGFGHKLKTLPVHRKDLRILQAQLWAPSLPFLQGYKESSRWHISRPGFQPQPCPSGIAMSLFGVNLANCKISRLNYSSGFQMVICKISYRTTTWDLGEGKWHSPHPHFNLNI